MGYSPVFCVALCLLAAGGSLAQDRVRVPSLTLPETMAIIGFSPGFFLSPSLLSPQALWMLESPKPQDA